jgi:HTH-type transcriptional regulator/antitoxin HipB
MKPLSSPVQIGSILVTRRKHLKLSQSQVAARVGLSQNRLSVLENNPTALTTKQLLALLNVLGLEMAIEEGATPRLKTEG